uniref:SFRICE_026151 n=1 Tax=Spodoptera frugiperda TaxID=7108 RepID=A0A2H1VEQ2_SPOFR
MVRLTRSDLRRPVAETRAERALVSFSFNVNCNLVLRHTDIIQESIIYRLEVHMYCIFPKKSSVVLLIRIPGVDIEVCDLGARCDRGCAQGGGEVRAGRSKRPSASSTGSLGRGALSDPDLQSRLQPNLPAFWVRICVLVIVGPASSLLIYLWLCFEILFLLCRKGSFKLNFKLLNEN